MEHRWYRRVRANTDVLLYHNAEAVARRRLTNLSLNGMLVQPGCIEFCRNTTLEVEFELRLSAKVVRCRIPVLVTHSSYRGTGLMFEALDRECSDLLRRYLSQSEATQTRRAASRLF